MTEDEELEYYFGLTREQFLGLDLEKTLIYKDMTDGLIDEFFREYKWVIDRFLDINSFRMELEWEIERKTPKKPKPKPIPKKTYLYLIRDERNNLVKIGRSKNPSARERTLQSEMPLLSLFWKVEGFEDEEVKLHEIFSDKRIRGEWFQLDESDVDFIKSLKWREGESNE